MRLETSYTAALSERLNALERVVERFGLDDETMTREQFLAEQKALTTALMFLSVGAAQFEVPWDAVVADAQENAIDNFRAFEAFRKTYNDLPLLSKAHTSSPHVFSNKQVVTYDFPNGDWPLVNTIANIIDTFLSHPSYGIEAILAVRIRHDNLRREFASAFATVRQATLTDTAEPEKRLCLNAMEPKAYTALQTWIDKYMNTGRSADGSGIFRFAPAQSEMEMLVKSCAAEPELRDVVVKVVAWLRSRMEEHLATARDKFSGELKDLLRSATLASKDDLVGSGAISPQCADNVANAVSSSLLRRADELLEWFQMPSEERATGLQFFEMKLAVEGRFRAETEKGELTSSFYAPKLRTQIIEPNNIRSVFDLWSELTINALKYKKTNRARLRVREFESNEFRGLMFSSLSPSDVVEEREYKGELGISESMLSTGKSGLTKVAALSAATVGSKVVVRVFQRKNGFHVAVPFSLRPML